MDTRRTIHGNGEWIEYTFERADRRTLAVLVMPDGRVRARVPRRMAEHVVERFIADRAGWIVRKRVELAEREAARGPALTAAELAEARRLFADRVDGCWERFARPHEVRPELRVRLMRSRWGSLTASGRITLNACLVRASLECLDAVIFHELCHLRVRGHGPGFYRELARYVPDWKARRAELKRLL